MNIDLLVKMTNEIGDFFVSESGAANAPRDVAGHLRRYWEPRMRKQIIEHYRRGGAGLNELSAKAIGILATSEPPAPIPPQGSANPDGSAPAAGGGTHPKPPAKPSAKP